MFVVVLAGHLNCPLVHEVQVIYWGPLVDDPLILTVFLLLDGKQHASDGPFRPHEVVESLSQMAIGIPGQLDLHVLRQPRLHEILQQQIATAFLTEPLLQKVSNFILIFLLEFQFLHIAIKDDQIDSIKIPLLPEHNDGLDHIIHDVTVDHHPKAHPSQCIRSLYRVVGSNVSVTDLAHGIDPPVESVEILEAPWQVVDGGVSSR